MGFNLAFKGLKVLGTNYLGRKSFQ